MCRTVEKEETSGVQTQPPAAGKLQESMRR
jgi:hypothetical protein